MRQVWREITIPRGGPFAEPFRFWDRRAAGLSGERLRRLNLTGVTGELVARDGDGGPVVLRLATDNGGMLVDGPGGTITLQLAAVAVAALPTGRFPYAWRLVSSGGVPVPLMRGLLTVPSCTIGPQP